MGDQLTEAARLRFNQIAAKQKKLQADNGIAFYTPHWKQHLFHVADFERRYLRTGNRFGKSDCGAAEDVAMALGERPWYKRNIEIIDGDRNVRESHQGHEHHPYVSVGLPKRPVKILIIVTTWDKANEVFTNQEKGDRIGKLFKLIPKNKLVRVSKNNGGHINRITVKSKWGGESVIAIYTVQAFKQNPTSAESSDWDAIHVDEPCPEALYKGVARGLADRDGRSWFTCTPLDEMWINRFFIPKEKARSEFPDGMHHTHYYVLTGSIFDNPHISAKGRDSYLADLTPEERQCRAQGIPSMYSGLIFKAYDREKHVYIKSPAKWEAIDRPPNDYTIRYACDIHPATPNAILFAATSPANYTYFYAEVWENCRMQALCNRIKQILDGRKPEAEWWDPSAWIEHQALGYAPIDDVFAAGLSPEPGSKDLDFGLLKSQEALEQKDEYGSPLLFFGHHLVRFQGEIDEYRWNPKRPNKPVDENDHQMENFRRLIVGGLSYVNPNRAEVEHVPYQQFTKPDFNLPLHSSPYDLEDYGIPSAPDLSLPKP